MKKKDVKKLVFCASALVITLGVLKLFSLSFIASKQSAATKISSDRNTPCSSYCGRIVVIKNTDPDSDQDFLFTHNVPGYVSPVMLDDDGTLGNPLNNSITFATAYNGTYSISEVSSPDYVTSVSCTDPSGGTMFGDSSAIVGISDGETVTCTFTNKRLYSEVTVDPVSVPGTVPSEIDSEKIPGPRCESNSWRQRADMPQVAEYMPGRRHSAVGFSVGNMGYLGAGAGPWDLYRNFWQYNPLTNHWTRIADYPGGGLIDAVGFSIGDKGYVGSGTTSSGGQGSYPDFWEYNPGADEWLQRTNVGYGRAAVGFSVGNLGYISTGAGSGGGMFYDFHKEYDPIANTWTPRNSFDGGARKDAVGFSIGDKGYIGTGVNAANTYQQDFWEYDPINDAWTQKAEFPGGARKDAVGFSIGNYGYVGTGFGDGSHQDFWRYDPVNNSWLQMADFIGSARGDAVGFSIGDKGYIGTGHTTEIGVELNGFYEYCP